MPINNQDDKHHKVIKTFIDVSFPGFGGKKARAKVDTGAYSGALHCVKIQKSADVLYFTPLDGKQIIKSENFAIKYVTSSNGKRQQRFFVPTTIAIDGRAYPIVISLTDRKDMRWPVLIGRKFLKQNKFLLSP